MASSLSLIEEVNSSFPRKFYSDILEMTLAVARFTTEDGFRLSGKKVTLNAIAVSQSKIKALNRRYRGLGTATDILSFGEELGGERVTESTIFLGELFFSPQFIRQQAKDDKRPYEQSLIYIFSHGILHLLGYDHSKKMFQYQDVVTERLFESPLKIK